MADFKEDTAIVKREFEALSNSTQIFVWALVGCGLFIGILLGGWLGWGIAVEEVEGSDCIEHEDTLYCADEGDAGTTEDAEAETDDGEDGGDTG